MTSSARRTLWQLYDTPLEALDLPERSLRFLKWDGIITLEDCVVFFYREAHQRSRVLPVTSCLMYNEVEPKMKEYGYWSYVMDANIWEVLKDAGIYPLKRRVALWQGEERNLYEIKLEQLDLSEADLLYVKMSVYRNLGQVVDYCLEIIHQNPYAFYDRHKLEIPHRAAYHILLPLLEALGYWPLIEENIDTKAFLEVGW